jgi:hypothetical protein
MPPEMPKSDRENHPSTATEVSAPPEPPQDPSAGPPPEAPAAPRLRLCWLDKSALKHLPCGSSEDLTKLYALVDARMVALCREPELARLSLLSKLIAILTAKVEILESASDRLVSTGNLMAVREFQRMLDAAHRRLVALIAEHRLATQGGRRAVTVAVVAQAAQVNVRAGR